MLRPGRALAAVGAIVLMGFVVGGSLAGAQQAAPKGKEQPKKLDKTLQVEAQSLQKIVNQVATGQLAPTDVPMLFVNHYLKARDGRTFVPFTVVLDGAKVTSPSLSMYLRVVKRGAETVMPPAQKPLEPGMVWVNTVTQIFHRLSDPYYGRGKDSKFVAEEEAIQGGAREARGEEKIWMPEPAWEDLYFMDVKSAAGRRFSFTRAFAVAGGDYDLYLALKERNPSASKTKVPPRMTVLKQALKVPEYWNNELATSSIILAEKVEQLTAPLTEQQLAERPYTFGAAQVVPSLDHVFSKKDSLSMLFQIYNATFDANKKPDVVVEYNFYVKPVDGPEKFFNKTDPQMLNAQTVAKDFDTAAGHQLSAGQEIPLAIFPEGTWRLEIKVTDRIAKKTLTENVPFTITAG